MTEHEFLDCLRPRYGGQDYALLPQVRNATGFSRRVRTADALAVSLWPSRGIGAVGFEFKDSRADWLKELKEAAKAEEIGRYCREWWLVVSDPAIVAKGELPAAWGLMHATGETVKVIAAAAPCRDAQEPAWGFVAAVMRAAVDVVTPEAEIGRRVAKARREEQDRATEAYRAKLVAARAEADRERDALLNQVAAFEAASGVKLDRWSERGARQVGEAVRFVLAGGLAGLTGELARIADAAGRVKCQAEAALEVGTEPVGEPLAG